MIGMRQKLTKPYSPHANGLRERTNRILAGRLAKRLMEDLEDWPDFLRSRRVARRTSENTTTLYAPLELTTVRPINRPNQVWGNAGTGS